METLLLIFGLLTLVAFILAVLFTLAPLDTTSTTQPTRRPVNPSHEEPKRQ